MRDVAISNQCIQEGHFAKKQLFSRNRLIAWSHRRRLQVGLELAQEFNGKRVLDYGCGDGSFLAMLMQGSAPPLAAVGVEVDPRVIADNRKRFSDQRAVDFELENELDKLSEPSTFDVVICMEVLEHMIEIEPLLERFARLLTPSGKLLVSVPVETGPPLLLKQAARRLAGWRGIGDYPGTTSYTLRELIKGLLANGKRQHIIRPIHTGSDGRRFHDHKGFNWMRLRNLMGGRFYLEKTRTSPVGLSPLLASQIWFLLRKK